MPDGARAINLRSAPLRNLRKVLRGGAKPPKTLLEMSPVDTLSFRRAFLRLLLLIVVPSVALVTFAIVAIVNERAAVTQRLQDTWNGRLESLGGQLLQRLNEELPSASGAAAGSALFGSRFAVREGRVETADPRLEPALAAIQPELSALPERPILFSFSDMRGTYLLIAARHDSTVEGAEVGLEPLGALATRLAAQSGTIEGVRFEVAPIHPAREGAEGLFSRLAVQAREAALGPVPLARRPLAPPLQELELVVLPTSGDPVATASNRNRTFYGVLLGVLYVLISLGVVLTARTLYREARLSRLKTDFVSLVSHELRTPLTSIRMFIETLSMGRVQEKAQHQQVLDMLAKETERLSQMIEHVLDWARIESGRQVYHPEVVAVSQVVDSAVTAFRAQRLDTPVDLTARVDPELPGIRVDREALAGAVLNLLQNAFKYGGQPKKIALRARPDAQGVAIEVEDNGTGIAPRERRRIFERFYRVDNLLTRKTEGSGLGLSITKRIVEAHRGKVTVKSEVGRGSCFTIHLPPSERA